LFSIFPARLCKYREEARLLLLTIQKCVTHLKSTQIDFEASFAFITTRPLFLFVARKKVEKKERNE